MSAFAIVTCYLAMCVYDLSILSGTVWLINNGWSAWWMVLAIAIAAGSSPQTYLTMLKEHKS